MLGFARDSTYLLHNFIGLVECNVLLCAQTLRALNFVLRDDEMPAQK